ncbi:hypothetical protein HDV00_010839 [Rhizophlyctis rosea]|nr:hypothetical protein HDV00_010839 [Rhizophlyctis rosea]
MTVLMKAVSRPTTAKHVATHLSGIAKGLDMLSHRKTGILVMGTTPHSAADIIGIPMTTARTKVVHGIPEARLAQALLTQHIDIRVVSSTAHHMTPEVTLDDATRVISGTLMVRRAAHIMGMEDISHMNRGGYVAKGADLEIEIGGTDHRKEEQTPTNWTNLSCWLTGTG